MSDTYADDETHSAMNGVRPGWLRLIADAPSAGGCGRAVAADARAALRGMRGSGEEWSPQNPLIFEALRWFEPEDTRIVILGKGPRGASKDDAAGLSFSVPRVGGVQVLTPALRAIIANLRGCGLAPAGRPLDPRTPSKGDAYSGDLRAWAAQGVLLLDTELAVQASPCPEGAPGAAVAAAWRDFASGLLLGLVELMGRLARPLVVMLWGDDAQKVAAAIAPGRDLRVYTWGHPSPPAGDQPSPAARFEQAPHFTDAAAFFLARGLPPCVFDPLARTFVFTDGSCAGNGGRSPVASFAVFVASGPLRLLEISGMVAPQTYAFHDPGDPAAGFGPTAGTPRAPSNNRGEYLAWCWALFALLRGRLRGRIEIVSDCKLMIDTLETWLPTRRRRGTASKLENFDLVQIAEALLAELRRSALEVILTHVRSHQKKPPVSAPGRERLFWVGNDRADKKATALTAPRSAGSRPIEVVATGCVFARHLV